MVRVSLSFSGVDQKLFLRKAVIVSTKRNQPLSQYLVCILLRSVYLVDEELSIFDKSDKDLKKELSEKGLVIKGFIHG